MHETLPEHGRGPTRPRSADEIDNGRAGLSVPDPDMAEQAVAAESAGAAAHAETAGGLTFLTFLDGVVCNKAKTDNLAYLMNRAGAVIAVVLVLLSALAYIVMFNAAIEIKLAVGGASAVVITGGSLILRIRKRK